MTQTAIFGGGCFWCTEAIFDQLKGVSSVVSGYAGGTMANPTYEQVSHEETGHAEVIKVEFDPSVISYETLLDVFFHTHDATTMNRQGNDEGTQYRSIILYDSEDQKKAAEKALKKIIETNEFERPPVTEIDKLDKFYTAEQYHQKFYKSNELHPYCAFVISPKLASLRNKYSTLLKSS